MGGKKKYINIFGSFTEPFNYFVGLKSFKTKPVYSNHISNCMPQNNKHFTSVQPPRALATSTIMWVRSQFHPFWAVVNKSNAG